MNKEEILALLAEQFSELKTEILTTVDTKNAGLATNLTRKMKSFEAPTSEPEKQKDNSQELTLKSMQETIDKLQGDLKAKEQAAHQALVSSKISEVVGSSDTNAQGVLIKLMNTEYGNKLVNENDKWYVKDGESAKEFDEVFKEYLETDNGKFFVKASPAKGTNSSKSEKVNTPSDSESDNLIGAFANF